MAAQQPEGLPPRLDEVVIAALRSPSRVVDLAKDDWGRLIRRARYAGLLGRLATMLADEGALSAIPESPRRHFEAALTRAEQHRRDVLWEVRCIERALDGLGIPLILLKGAAYAAAALPPMRGRIFSDIDILVPRDAIRPVEQRLVAAGWQPSPVDRWDERFYREWMHQIPPMAHAYRGTVVDLHHTIVPPTARVKLPAATLFEMARPLSHQPGTLTLSPADMVVHSATHLFNEGEFGRSLRDLVDLDLLLRHFAADPDFWPVLLARADDLDLARPVFYALRYTQKLLGTPVPTSILAQSARRGPGRTVRRLMDALFERVLSAPDLEQSEGLSSIARTALYVRGHYLRLPPRLLLPHLVRKAIRGAR